MFLPPMLKFCLCTRLSTHQWLCGCPLCSAHALSRAGAVALIVYPFSKLPLIPSWRLPTGLGQSSRMSVLLRQGPDPCRPLHFSSRKRCKRLPFPALACVRYHRTAVCAPISPSKKPARVRQSAFVCLCFLMFAHGSMARPIRSGSEDFWMM
jgi:hypothetical protein